MPENDSVLLLYSGDQLMGTLHRIKGGKLIFRYDDKYREIDTVVPLSLSMSFIEKEETLTKQMLSLRCEYPVAT